MMEVSDGVNHYVVALIGKLAAWDWLRPHWNSFSAFFDAASIVLEEDEEAINGLLKMFEDFKQKFGMEVDQAEIKNFMRLTGQSTKRMVKQTDVDYTSYGSAEVRQEKGEEIRFLEINTELRKIKLFVQSKVKEVAGKMEFGDSAS